MRAGFWRRIPIRGRAQPLIGAGFSLDLPEREHPQLDPMNPHPFLEPSSADLWQAAGFDPARLDGILQVFYERRAHVEQADVAEEAVQPAGADLG